LAFTAIKIEPTIIRRKYSRKHNVHLAQIFTSSSFEQNAEKITCDEPKMATLVEEGLSLLYEISWK